MQTAAIGFIVWWAIVSICLLVLAPSGGLLIFQVLQCILLGFCLALSLGITIAGMAFIILMALGYI